MSSWALIDLKPKHQEPALSVWYAIPQQRYLILIFSSDISEQQSNALIQRQNVLSVSVSQHKVPLSVSHPPDPFSVRIKKRRPLWDTEDAVIVPSVLVIKVRGVEEVETLQGTLHCQTEAGWAAPVTRETTLWRRRTCWVNNHFTLLSWRSQPASVHSE